MKHIKLQVDPVYLYILGLFKCQYVPMITQVVKVTGLTGQATTLASYTVRGSLGASSHTFLIVLPSDPAPAEQQTG